MALGASDTQAKVRGPLVVVGVVVLVRVVLLLLQLVHQGREVVHRGRQDQGAGWHGKGRGGTLGRGRGRSRRGASRWARARGWRRARQSVRGRMRGCTLAHHPIPCMLPLVHSKYGITA